MPKQQKRDTCMICRQANRNAVGHIAQFCCYAGGPYHGRVKDAIRDKRAIDKQNRQAQTSQVTQLLSNVQDSEKVITSRLTKLELRVDQINSTVTKLDTLVTKLNNFIKTKPKPKPTVTNQPKPTPARQLPTSTTTSRPVPRPSPTHFTHYEYYDDYEHDYYGY